MKPNFFSQVLATVCLISGTALAGPLQRADVPAEPSWVLHFDCDGLRPTGIGRYLLAEMEKPDAQARFAAFQSTFSFDPRTQLRGLTLYSIGTSPADGILIVYADFDPARLTILAQAAKDYQTSTYKQHTIHSWIDQKRNHGADGRARTYAAIHNHRVVFGQQEQRVFQALDVMDNSAPTLSGNPTLFPQLGVGGASAYIQAAGRKLKLPDSDPNAAVFRLSKSISLDVGETQGTMNASLVLEANDEPVAGHILSIAQGLVSLMKLQQEKPESVRLSESLSLKQQGSRVIGTMALPVDEAIRFMQADAGRKAAARQKQQTAPR